MRSAPLPGIGTSREGTRTRWGPVAEALRQALASGSLEPGELLPSTRELAASYGVHRQTVMVALDALCAEGWLRAEARRGYRVLPPDPALPSTRPQRRASFQFRARPAGGPALPALDGVRYPLHAATPDPALLPLPELRAAYAHALRRDAGALDDATPWGNPALERALRAYLRRARGLRVDRVLLTCGSQEAITLVARALLRPGDAVAVEDPGYPPAWQAFRAAGAEVVPVPVDAQGLRVDALAPLLARRRIRLVYVTPNHQYPTTVTLSAPRRRALLERTLAEGVPILEDDYDHEYHFRGVPQPALAASGRAPHVLYAASLSKLVAPGVRVGMLCGGGEVLEALAEQRQVSVRAGDGVTQAALASWVGDGGFERHVRRAKRVYAERREAALAALTRAAGKVPLELSEPDGGLAVWCRWPSHPVLELARRALARGVAVLPGPLAALEAPSQGMRLAYGRVSPRAFAEAVAILVAEARRM
ncbi:MAG TPA: PLP-dependent aminotransferase family protein [Polyangiaceae bacterium]|nr:PLP-dependent aminotransferase family protein [Polyangiaceae bacterium]